MILHHYDVSPYSEMIRLMLGYTELSWQSAISPPKPPRPIVDPLVGGYRRIPVAQIGADLFCDTRLIAAEIARITERPELSFATALPEASEFATHTHDDVFMPVVTSAQPKAVLKMLITKYWPWQILGLMRDRASVGKNSKAPRLSGEQRRNLVKNFKLELEAKASDNHYLFGEKPSVADFAAYHIVWFADLTRSERFLGGFHQATEWQQRMQAIGHGQHTRVNKTQVFQAAKEAEPRAISESLKNDEHIGKTVTIQPTDYAQDATTGQLVGANDERWIIARHTSEFGTVHVHFPCRNYTITTKI